MSTTAPARFTHREKASALRLAGPVRIDRVLRGLREAAASSLHLPVWNSRLVDVSWKWPVETFVVSHREGNKVVLEPRL